MYIIQIDFMVDIEKGPVKEWIAKLATASKGNHYPALWKRLHAIVSFPTRRKCEVNLYKLEKHAKDGDNIIVPGKVLSEGQLSRKFDIAAIELSKPAIAKLKASGCNIVSIDEMIKRDKVKIMV